MRIAVYVGPDHPLSVEDAEGLAPGPADVVVEIGASGVCHSDLSVSRGLGGRRGPTVLGHEGAGRVAHVGAAVTRVSVGDRVIASFVPACGRCWWCLNDQSNLCATGSERSAVMRWRRSDGSEANAMSGLGTFSEQMTVHESSVVRVHTDLPDDQIALIGCGVTTGVGAALFTAGVKAGETVAVIGCGGVGQSVIQGARAAGAGRIIAVDPQQLKRDTALTLGATDAVDPSNGDPVDAVRELTDGRGVDYAFEVVGHPDLLLQAFKMARRGGAAVAVGMPQADATMTLPAFPLFYDEKRLLGCFYGSAQVRRDFQRILDLVASGRLDIAAMVTRHCELDEVNDAFRAMEAGEVIRTVITH
ncbi:MAG: Zn-dependent alcohol dehydrogenase [Acidimicrobiales bacterium]